MDIVPFGFPYRKTGLSIPDQWSIEKLYKVCDFQSIDHFY